jgi:hypothetical protein
MLAELSPIVVSMWILSAFAAIVFCLVLLRHLAQCLGLLRIHGAGDETPEKLAPDAPGWYAKYYVDLIELGFQPLGIYWENMSLSKRSREHVFLIPGQGHWALLYFLWRSEPWVTLKTSLESGAIVSTWNRSGSDIVHGDFRRHYVATRSMKFLMQEHQRHVSKLVEAGDATRPLDSSVA